MKKQPKNFRNKKKFKENLNSKKGVKEKEINENFEDEKENYNYSEEKEGVENLNEKTEENEKLNLKIKKLEKEVEEFKDLNLRLKAEFDNFKRRTQKEKLTVYDSAKSDCIFLFLEVLDNLERAVGLVEKKDKFSEGIDLVVSKFYDVLKKVGVVEIESLGKSFNPNFHEAIKVVNDEKLEKNVVCEVFQKGFMLKDLVLRHALVVVANP